MKTKVSTVFNIEHGNGIVGGAANKYNYESAEEAIKSAKDFKENPKGKTPSMSDSNVEYWKNQTYRVVKIVKEITEIEVI